ncbi:hypothetical protein [Methylobacterium planeticum]|uniref:Uncharacterized protein n=1 Tax=Methylobacterium planeticum TaxID=2615211 RepID=A0A6N6MN92_9HYPH|nr:hypothetical protein [Methylobacterium planeticum]KAB1072753.1 hypothetical protein F6X51_14175 [Methylobacterium planeticum]
MIAASEIKSRFRRRLHAADLRKDTLRQKLIEEGTRVLEPVIGVLAVMAEVLDEEGNAHGRIEGLSIEVDDEDLVCLHPALHRDAGPEHKLTIKYGPVLGGSNFLSVSGLGSKYAETLFPAPTNAISSLGRSVGNDLLLEEGRAGELADILRDLVEEFYAGEAEPAPVHHLRLVQSA